MNDVISIIIPVYNAERYLEQCLDSILLQTYKNLEVVLVDDGSKDSSPELCDNYQKKDSRVNVFHIPNGGCSNARNYGLTHTSGDWIMLMDADDWMENTTCETLLRVAHENRCKLVSCSYVEFYKNIEVIKGKNDKSVLVETDMKSIIVDTFDAKNDIYNKFPVTKFPWGKLIHASIIHDNKLMFPVSIQPFEDELFGIMIDMHVEKMSVVNQALIHYRMCQGSVTNAGKKDHLLNGLNVLKIVDSMAELKQFINEKDMKIFTIRHILYGKEKIVTINDYNMAKIIDFMKSYFDDGVYRELLDSIDIKFINENLTTFYTRKSISLLKDRKYRSAGYLLVLRKLYDKIAGKEKKYQFWS